MPAWRDIQRALRWLGSRFSGGGIILLYHRVARCTVDPFHLCVSPERFQEQMAILCQWAHPMILGEFVSATGRRQLPPRSVVVTFDDGYVDTLREALPVLAKNNVPATVFVTTGNPGEPFWWDRLSRAILEGSPRSSKLEIQAGGQSHAWSAPASSPRRRLRALHEIHTICRGAPVIERDRIVRQVETWFERGSSEDERALTRDEIRQLAAASLMSVGAHTVHHPVLSNLTPEVQLQELSRSRSELEALIGKHVTTMSYPYGMPGRDFDHATMQAAQRAGYVSACAAHADVVKTGTDIWQLPRLWVQNWRGDEFIRRLRRWVR